MASSRRQFYTPGLRYYREKALLTVNELAEKSGTARTTVGPLEGGKRTARPATIRKLAAALGVAPEDLTRKPPEELAPGKEPAPTSQQERLFNTLPDESRRALETLNHYTGRLEAALRRPDMADEEIVAYVGIVHVAGAMIPPLLADPKIGSALHPLAARFARAGRQLIERVEPDAETEQVEATVHYLDEYRATA